MSRLGLGRDALATDPTLVAEGGWREPLGRHELSHRRTRVDYTPYGARGLGCEHGLKAQQH